MTQKEFDELPLRLQPAHLRRILGLTDKSVHVWLDEHPECLLERKPGGKRIASKAKVAKALKLVT